MNNSETFLDITYWQALNRKSLLRFFLFSELARRPMHGYELADAVSICCDGVRPTDAMVYPTLNQLERDGYIMCTVESTGERKRNVCHLTEKGHRAFRTAAMAWAQAIPQIEGAVRQAGTQSCCETDELRRVVDIEGALHETDRRA